MERRSTGWTDTIARRPSSVWVAERDGEVVGFADGGVARVPDDGCMGQLYSIYLLRSVQGQGIGRALLQRVFADLRVSGYASARVEVLKGNQPAISFYESCGAEFVREAPFRMMDEEMVELIYAWRELPVY